MDLERIQISLDQNIDEGSIHGYVTKPKTESQLKNYLDEQGVAEAAPLIQEQFNKIAILKNMYVNEEERGEGIGTSLLSVFIDEACSHDAEAIILVADTSESNKIDLVNWYEGFDFKIIHGERSSYPVMVRETID